jgi:HEAT repeat protein
MQAVYALGCIGPEASPAVDLLISVVKGGQNRRGSSQSVDLFLPAPEMLPFIGDINDRCLAIDALGKIKDPKAVPVLVMIMQQIEAMQLRVFDQFQEGKCYLQAIGVLSEIGTADPAAVNALNAARNVPDSGSFATTLRNEADTALRKIGSKQ